MLRQRRGSTLNTGSGSNDYTEADTFDIANTELRVRLALAEYVCDIASPQVFCVQVSPTALSNGTPVQVFALTSTNVRKVESGIPAT